MDFSQTKLNTGVTVKFPVSMFVGNYKNVTSLEFVCQNSDSSIQMIGDLAAVTVNKIGNYVFKGMAKKIIRLYRFHSRSRSRLNLDLQCVESL